MGYLWDLIQAHLDAKGGRSASSLAREIGSKPQTLSSWKVRGVRELPDVETLRRLAAALGVPYESVLTAAEMDAGYVTDQDELAIDMANLSQEEKRVLRETLAELRGDTKSADDAGRGRRAL